MEIHVSDDMKLVTVWLTRAEQEDGTVQEQLKQIYARFGAKKYMVAQFHSGKEDLYSNTRDLLRFNRKRIEELVVQREKQAIEPNHSGRQSIRPIIQC